MKKLITLSLLSGVALFGLTSCGGNDEGKVDFEKARDEANKAIDESNVEEEADRLMREIDQDR